MAAIALLLPVTHMNRCDQKNKHGKCGDALYFNDTETTAAQAYVAHRRDSEFDSNVFLQPTFVVFKSVE